MQMYMPAQDLVSHIDRHVFRLSASCFQGCTVLHEAANAYGDNLGVVKLLLANGANVNAKDDHVSNSSGMLADGH